jgi:hypothetical protein
MPKTHDPGGDEMKQLFALMLLIRGGKITLKQSFLERVDDTLVGFELHVHRSHNQEEVTYEVEPKVQLQIEDGDIT